MSADHNSPPPLPEPETPAWLTGLGGVLLAMAVVWFLTSVTADQRKAAEDRAAATAQTAPAASASAH